MVCGASDQIVCPMPGISQRMTGKPDMHPVDVTHGLGAIGVVEVAGGTRSELVLALQSAALSAQPLAMSQYEAACWQFSGATTVSAEPWMMSAGTGCVVPTQ